LTDRCDTADKIVRELSLGSRVVVTDMAIRMGPWLRQVESRSPWAKGSKNKFKPELGLLGYLMETYGQTFQAEDRVFILPERDAKEFYLRRYSVTDGVWIEYDSVRDDKGLVESFKTDKPTFGCLYVMDECWRTLGARQWQTTGKGTIFYAAQHRKLADEWFLISQHSKQIDVAMRQLAQDYWVVRNHSKLKVGFFRQPEIFTVNVYSSAPSDGTGGVTPMETKVFRLDKRGLGGCYDTAAGTGVLGGGAADLNERKNGRPFWALILILCGLVSLLWLTPDIMGWAASKFFGLDKREATNKLLAANGSTTNKLVIGPTEKREPLAFPISGKVLPLQAVLPPPLEVCGTVFDGKKLSVLMSDGSIRPMVHHYALTGSRVLFDGEYYEVRTVKPSAPLPPDNKIQPEFIYEREPEKQSTMSVSVIGARPASAGPAAISPFLGSARGR